MELDMIKRGLRAEIKKRQKETYATCQTNVRDMCTDVLSKLEEQEKEIAELKDENQRLKRALWLARAERARDNSILLPSKFMRNVWDNVERKCLKKAEEYK